MDTGGTGPLDIIAPAGMAVSQSTAKRRSAPSPPSMESNSRSSSGLAITSCPICLEPMREAFMTACGHSFCYQCISRHLVERQSCPSCFHALDHDQVYPNFALNKLITQMDSAAVRPLSIVQQLRNTVESDEALDPQDIDALLLMLQEKKQAMRNSERQFDMAILRQFLTAARSKKAAAIEALRKDLRLVEEDLDFVADQLEQNAPCDDEYDESRQLSRACMLSPSSRARAGDAAGVQVPNRVSADTFAAMLDRHQLPAAAPAASSTAIEQAKHSRRVDEHYDDLEAYYFDHRMRGVGEEGLDEFMETLSTVARYERFRQTATLRYGDSTASTAIVASIEFDRDEEIFAVAGVARKIKIYDYANVVQQADAWNESTAGKAHLRQPRKPAGRH
ncbi:coatomer subunit alpha, partial [Coemansia erecta]